MVEPQLFLELLVGLFTDPPGLDGGSERLDGGIGRQVRHIVFLLPGRPPLADEPGGRIVTHITDGATIVRTVDVDAFAIVVRNLIENALVHGDPAGPVAVSLDGSGNVVVVNGGPVIPADRLDSLKTRFRRGEGNAEGSGLGLAIAETLVGQMGGRLELYSPVTGGASGCEARIVI